MTKPKSESSHATLTLTIEYGEGTGSLVDIIDAAKEVIEKAIEQGSVSGYLDLHRSGRIFVEDLK